MDQLEYSTLELINRRSVKPYRLGYAMILVIVTSLAVLPLVRVDVVLNTAGIIRPWTEPPEICSPVAGILDSTVIRENLRVNGGDTVAWVRKILPETRIREYRRELDQYNAFIGDINDILTGMPPQKTSRFIQSYRYHQASLQHLQLRLEYLRDEFKIARQLFREEVIPLNEFRRAESEYLLLCARIEDTREQYRSGLEEELHRIKAQHLRITGEIELLRTELADYCIIAAVSGTVQDCSGLSAGSVIAAGTPLAIISPSGRLTAECYVKSEEIAMINPGTRVRLSFDGFHLHGLKCIETKVEEVGEDVMLVKGDPCIRVRCRVDNNGQYRKGMTVHASFILMRQSLARVIIERIDRRFNPMRTISSK